MSGRSATTSPELGSTKRSVAARPAPPSPSASTSPYSNAGVMTRANPRRSNVASRPSTMRRRADAASGAWSRMPVGSLNIVVLSAMAEPAFPSSLSSFRRFAASPRSLLDRVADDAVLEEADEHLRQLDRHLLLRLARRRAQVRARDQVLVLEQRRRLRRLLAEHVQRRARQLSRSQRLQHRALVDDAAARAVDQVRPLLHLRERRAVEQVLRLGDERNVQRDEVRLRDQLVERHGLHARRQLL